MEIKIEVKDKDGVMLRTLGAVGIQVNAISLEMMLHMVELVKASKGNPNMNDIVDTQKAVHEMMTKQDQVMRPIPTSPPPGGLPN